MTKEKTEFVIFMGTIKHRMRCPECGRAAPDNFCIVHGNVKALDLTESAKAQEMTKQMIRCLT